METQQQLSTAQTELEVLEHFKHDFVIALERERTKLEVLKSQGQPLDQIAYIKSQIVGLEGLIRDQDDEITAQKEKVLLLKTALEQERDLMATTKLVDEIKAIFESDKPARIALLQHWKFQKEACTARISKINRLTLEAERLFHRTQTRAGQGFELRVAREELCQAHPFLWQALSVNPIPKPPLLGTGVDDQGTW